MRFCVCALALVSLAFHRPAFAQDTAISPARPESVLVAAGPDLNDNDLDIFELIYTRSISSWDWGVGETTRLSTRLWISVGVLDQNSDSTAFGTVGPVFYLHGNGHAFLNFGIRLTALADDVVGSIDMGGPVQFASHLGVGYWFDGGWEIGIRVAHISNGRLFEPNPDINFVMLQVGYGF